ncbi:MAG: YraN family protein [Chloroflexota bacterium]|nr:YraN family protein [Chloroflexota bacterium]
MDSRRALGRQGEAAAATYLEAHGLTILARGWRPTDTAMAPYVRGELDLIAQDGDTLVFVEVRTRRAGVGPAAESVTPAKRKQVLTLALAYLAVHDLPDSTSWRIDVIALHFGPTATPTIRWLRSAVEDEG